MESELVLTLLKVFGVFALLSFVVFWIGLVWWVSQDVTSRTNDKIILAAAVAFATIFGPVGVLLYLIVRPRQTIKESYREMLEIEINRKLASMDMAYCPFCGANLERDIHSPHPDQLSITPMETDEDMAELGGGNVEVAEHSETMIRSGKLLSVRITDSLMKATKATVRGATLLLTPLPGSTKKVESPDASGDDVQAGVVESPAEAKKPAKVAAKTTDETETTQAAKPSRSVGKTKVSKPSRRGGSSKRGKK